LPSASFSPDSSPQSGVQDLSWFYLVFRSTPVCVQLILGLSIIYPTIDVGFPFHPLITLPTGEVFNVFQLAVIGLALQRAAYIAENRAGRHPLGGSRSGRRRRRRSA
jgi:ABC-type amino acid transport system permease subunit